jgi:hypothetical protein
VVVVGVVHRFEDTAEAVDWHMVSELQVVLEDGDVGGDVGTADEAAEAANAYRRRPSNHRSPREATLILEQDKPIMEHVGIVPEWHGGDS